MIKLYYVIFFCFWISYIAVGQIDVSAHAHNDYEQKHPLTQALSLGFNSIEVDLVLYNNELIITHDDKDLDTKPKFEALYLKQLNAQREKLNKLILLIDIKYNDGVILDTLHQLVSRYNNLFDTRKDDSLPIQILLSGDVPRSEIAGNNHYHYFFIDGRPEDLAHNLDSHIVPWVSTNFTNWSEWNGKKKPKRKQLIKANQLINEVHEQGKKIRFWKTEDNPLSWSVLLGLGVDIIGVDEQKLFHDFIHKVN